MNKHRCVVVLLTSMLVGTAMMAIDAAPAFAAKALQTNEAIAKPAAVQIAAACAGGQSCNGISSRSNGNAAKSGGPFSAGKSGQRAGNAASGRSCGTGLR